MSGNSMLCYFLFGLGFYVGLCLARKDTFIDAGWKSILLGFILGVLLWPIAIFIVSREDDMNV